MKKLAFIILMSSLIAIGCSDEKAADSINAAPSDSAGTANETSVAKDKSETAWVPVDSATEMKAWMEYATPGEAHKKMAKTTGTWVGETTSWMGNGAPPTKSKSTMINKMILDGRYQLSTFKGDMMGMSFEGMSIGGYDNHQKKYFTTWIDNMGTGFLKMEGTLDESSNKINYTGKMVNPANGIECNMREVYTMIDDNNGLMELYGPDSKTGKEYKTMEIKLSRKK
ncbi:MAG: DUF1579 domain-containing protein [Chitinophagaceae bacterium]|nr:MAG: DUF1579 domain-containing protein [Chitinophagaceae bacterium]